LLIHQNLDDDDDDDVNDEMDINLHINQFANGEFMEGE
jgi:hypothetical protein